MRKTYLESIQHFPKDVQEWLITERPHSATGLMNVPDPRFQFMVGRGVDFGFENLGLSGEELAKLEKAFVAMGVGIPESPYKLRYASNPDGPVIELGSGDDVMLPVHWMQGMYLVDPRTNVYTWIGKRVRPEQVGNIDFSLYRDTGDGWELR
jgi:hypothetical protein